MNVTIYMKINFMTLLFCELTILDNCIGLSGERERNSRKLSKTIEFLNRILYALFHEQLMLLLRINHSNIFSNTKYVAKSMKDLEVLKIWPSQLSPLTSMPDAFNNRCRMPCNGQEMGTVNCVREQISFQLILLFILAIRTRKFISLAMNFYEQDSYQKHCRQEFLWAWRRKNCPMHCNNTHLWVRVYDDDKKWWRESFKTNICIISKNKHLLMKCNFRPIYSFCFLKKFLLRKICFCLWGENPYPAATKTLVYSFYTFSFCWIRKYFWLHAK